jgi:uncharacterized protein (TIGR03435 family)
MNYKQDNGMISWSNFPMSFVVGFLEGAFHKPVLMQSDLSGNYDFTFQWQDPQQKEAVLNRELEEAGLELMPTNMPVEMLVVEKMK